MVKETHVPSDHSGKGGRNKPSDQSGEGGKDTSSDQSGEREEDPVEEKDKKKNSSKRIRSSSYLKKKNVNTKRGESATIHSLNRKVKVVAVKINPQ